MRLFNNQQNSYTFQSNKEKMEKKITIQASMECSPLVEVENLEFKPKPQKVRLPDRSGRGRGVPTMPPSGAPRPVFRPNMPAAGAGRGRGRDTPQRPPREQKPPLKPAQVASANPFGNAAATSQPIEKEEEDKHEQGVLQMPVPVEAPQQQEAQPSVQQETKVQDQKVEQPQQKELEEEKEDRPLQVRPTPPPPKEAVKPVESDIDTRKTGFFNMITSYLGFLNRRKQAQGVGKPASQMRYDEKEGRWIIEGEELSEDDEPPPPPPGARKLGAEIGQNDSSVTQEKKEEPQASGADALASIGFGGALANRNKARGRGATRGAPAQRGSGASRFASGQPNLKESEQSPNLAEGKAKDEGQNPERVFNQNRDSQETMNNATQLYNTALGDSTLDASKQDLDYDNNESILKDISLEQSQFLNQSQRIGQTEAYDPKREEMWQAIYTKQQNKIKMQKTRNQRQQAELVRQREENEQTIENFTQLCQDLKFRGMDEVDDLQSQIGLLEASLKQGNEDLAAAEFKSEKFERELSVKQILTIQAKAGNAADSGGSETAQIQSSLIEMDYGSRAQYLKYGILNEQDAVQLHTSLDRLLEAQCENEQLKWQISTLQVDQAHLVLELQKALKEAGRTSQVERRLQETKLEFSQSQEAIRKLREESVVRGQQELKLDSEEKLGLQQMITRLQAEKERIQEIARQRQRELDTQLATAHKQISALEQSHKQTSIELNGQTNHVARLQSQNEALNLKLNALQTELQQKDSKILQVQAVGQEERDRLTANKRSEKEKQDKSMREWCDEVKQLEGILNNKDEQFRELNRQKQEVEQQMEQMLTTQSEKNRVQSSEHKLQEQLVQQDQARQRLNEHISYLQGEIKKRDELLDQSDIDDDQSDSFGADYGEDEELDSDQIKGQMEKAAQRAAATKADQRKSTQQLLRDQLTECREELQKEIGKGIQTESESRMMTEELTQTREGLADILGIISDMRASQATAAESQQSTLLPSDETEGLHLKSDEDISQRDESKDSIDEEQEDSLQDAIQNVMTKMFEVQRGFQEHISDLNHKMQMEQLKLEDMDSLALDLEILQQEKQGTDQELVTLRMQLGKVQSLLAQQQNEADENQAQQQRVANELRLQVGDYDKNYQRMQEQHDSAFQQLQATQQQRLLELRSHFEGEIIPEMNQNHQRRQAGLQRELDSLRIDLQSANKQVEDLRDESSTLHQKLVQLQTEGLIAVKATEQDLKEAEDQNKLLAMEKQEVEQQAANDKQRMTSETKQARAQLSALESECLLVKLQNDNLANEMKSQSKQNESRFQELIEQREMHKTTSRELKQAMASLQEEVISLSDQLSAKDIQLNNLKEVQTQKEDQIFWQLVSQVNHLKQKLKEKEEQQSLSQLDKKPVSSIVGPKATTEGLDQLRQELTNQVDEADKARELVQGLFDKANEQIKAMVTQKAELLEANSELQNLYDYQLKINDNLNDTNDEVVQKLQYSQNKAESLQQEKVGLVEELGKLRSQFQMTELRLASAMQQAALGAPVQIPDTASDLKASELNEQQKAGQNMDEDSLVELQKQVDSLNSQVNNLEKEKSELQAKLVRKTDGGIQEDQDQDQKEITELRLKVEQLKEQVSKLQKDLSDEQMQSAVRESENGSLTERIQELEAREEKFKQEAQAMAAKFKEKISKEKRRVEELKAQKEELQRLQSSDSPSDELVHLRKERDDLQEQLVGLNKNQMSVIEYLEQSRDFTGLFDHTNNNTSVGESLVLETIKKMELNLSTQDSRIDALNQEKLRVLKQILECLSNSGIQAAELQTDGQSELTLESVLIQLELLLTNFKENQRQLNTILDENSELHKQNEELGNANHDLRYELQELNIKHEELGQIQDSMGKPDQRYEQLREESEALKSDFFAKASAYEQQISELQTSFTGPGIQADNPVSQKAISDKYADMSINQSTASDGEPPVKPQTVPKAQTKPKPKVAQPAPAQGSGGLLDSIASFFLTESELRAPEAKARPQGQGEESEYEYYEEYDQEQDDK